MWPPCDGCEWSWGVLLLLSLAMTQAWSFFKTKRDKCGWEMPVRFGVVTTVHISVHLPGMSSSLLCVTYSLNYMRSVCLNWGGETCVTSRSDLPHTWREKNDKCQVPFREGIGKVWLQRTKTSWFEKEAWLCLDSATSCWCWAVGTWKLFHGIQFIWEHQVLLLCWNLISLEMLYK